MIRLQTRSAKDTQAVAAELAALARPGDLVLLAGDLGSGKTVFVQGFGAALGIEEPITSPTFILMRGYASGRVPMVHMDVYRLEHLQEALDLGLAEVLDEGSVALIEWGDVVAPVLPSDFLEVRLEQGETDDDRVLTVRTVGTAWAARGRSIREALASWITEA